MNNSDNVAEYFSGYNDLVQYVNNTKHPSFDSFVSGNLQNIAQWSFNLCASNAKDLYKTWSMAMNKDLWTTIEQLKNEQTMVDSVCTSKSMNLMGKYSAKAETIISNNLDQQLKGSGGKRKQMTMNNEANNEAKRQHILNDTLNEEEQGQSSDSQSETVSVCSQGFPHATIATTTLRDVVFGMGYKKLAGIPWKEHERRLLEELDDSNPFIDIKLCMVPIIVKLLKSPLMPADLPVLKLSLSGIVNTMNQSQYKRIRPYLSKYNYECRLDELVNRFRGHGLDENSSVLLDKINLKLSDSNVEDTISFIDDLKKPYLKNCGRSRQGYRVLKILEQLLETMGSHTSTESEATTTRRIAAIIEEMFRWTPIKLVDGEHTSDCTQSMRQYNEIVYGNNGCGNLMGRRVDLLVKCGENNKDIELSSIEIKKPLTPSSLALEQQCKNLRANGAILGHLQAINPSKHFDHIVAMDWIGMAGYMYLLADIGHVYFGKKIGILTLPKSPKDFIEFKTTLDFLFAYQYSMLNLAVEAQSAMEKRQELDQICEIINIQDETETCPRHNIFLTPNARTKN
ncbi:hypothetical protein DFQ30_005419 [Apophysomyces sp. BC1015]|nr:hypothetical protein DFQ30_005419 [Apophysomyces sp. BC1015]